MASPTERTPAHRSIAPWFVVVLCAVGVFALPWVVPVPVRPIVSDAQVVGFSNRTAMLSLGIACLALFFIGWRSSGRGRMQFAPFVLAEGATDRLSRRTVVGFALIAVAAVAAAAMLLRDRPYVDSAYFVERMLYLANGSVPYRDFEFSYGPLLLYPQYGLWLLLRPLGAGLHVAYYAWLALWEVIGVAVLAYVINRTSTPRELKTLSLAVIVLFDLGEITLGLNNTPVRFVTHLACLLFVAHLADSERSIWRAALAAVGGFLLTYLISPEIGFSFLAGALAMFALRGWRVRRGEWLVVAGLLASGGLAVLGSRALSTFVGFAAGTLYFPVLPGPMALLYVGGMLLMALAVGTLVGSSSPSAAALHAGWLAACLVLIAPALGRADVTHVFWNGLGVFLGVPALAAARWPRLAAGYSVAFGGVSFGLILGLLLFSWGAGFAMQAVRAGSIAPGVAISLFGERQPDPDAYARRARDAANDRQPSERQMEQLASDGPVALYGDGYSPLGVFLAARGALSPINAVPFSLSWQDYMRGIESLDQAKVVAIPIHLYDTYAAMPTAGTGRGAAMTTTGGKMKSVGYYGIALGFPVSLSRRNPQFDSELAEARYLRENWKKYAEVGDYVLLRPVR